MYLKSVAQEFDCFSALDFSGTRRLRVPIPNKGGVFGNIPKRERLAVPNITVFCETFWSIAFGKM